MDASREPKTLKRKTSSRGKAGGPGNGVVRAKRRTRYRSFSAAQEIDPLSVSRNRLASSNESERSLAAADFLLAAGGVSAEDAELLGRSAKKGWDGRRRVKTREGVWVGAGALALGCGSKLAAQAVWDAGWRFDQDSAAEFLALGGLGSSKGLALLAPSIQREALSDLARLNEEALWRATRSAFGFNEVGAAGRSARRGWGLSTSPWPLVAYPTLLAGMAQRRGGAQGQALAWRFAFAGCCEAGERIAPQELDALEGVLRQGSSDEGLEAWRWRMKLLWVAGSSAQAPARLAALRRGGQSERLDWRALGDLGDALKEGDQRLPGWTTPVAWAQCSRIMATGPEVKAAFVAEGRALGLPPLGAAKAMALSKAVSPEGAHGSLGLKWWLRMAAGSAWAPPEAEFGASNHQSLTALTLSARGSGVEEFEAVLEWAGSIGKLEASWSNMGGAKTLEQLARGERERALWERACLRAIAASEQSGAARPKVRL
jgi:hypothetical protein